MNDGFHLHPASGRSTIWRATHRDSVHLPTAFHSETNVSHITRNSRRFGSLTSYIASEYQPYGRQFLVTRFTYSLHCKQTSVIRRATPGDSVHLLAALQSELNVSHMASNFLRFGSLTHCIASEYQSYDEQLPEIRFTYSLYCKRTSVIQ